VVKRVSEHTETIRYAPIGDPTYWEIGEPYIPRSLIPSEPELIEIEVRWDLDSKGQFVGVPTYREGA
jgi:hypothetical protein